MGVPIPASKRYRIEKRNSLLNDSKGSMKSSQNDGGGENNNRR